MRAALRWSASGARTGGSTEFHNVLSWSLALPIVVNSIADPGDGSLTGDVTLREAIDAANLGPGHDLIRFDTTGTFATPQTITLDGNDLAVTSSLTVSSPHADRITIDADERSRVFSIDDGSTTNRLVQLHGLTITGGRADSDSGGGILNRDNLTVTASRIIDNRSLQGGGIFNSEFFSGGQLTVTRSTISGNIATFVGGGISTYEGRLNVNASTVSGNTAGQGGGGIHSTAGFGDHETTITNSTLSGNTAQFGGGMNSEQGVTSIFSSTITGNTANSGDGSGVFSNSTFSGYHTFVQNSIISGNTNSDVDIPN